ncbi:unnamed protein product [Echinostoma caproni]|uniref:RUN domain-containing protein n=1 Tax=Echinostoma caproni TaxID=27848 RepID=A0A183AAL2_9TREM|nr:unnamed protein product [Echinostoma caproni]
MDEATRPDTVKMNAKFQLDGLSSLPMHPPDSNPLPTPVVSSVWLEQGEYFFDDEFAVTYDTNLVDPCDGNPSSCMTQSLGIAPATHGPLQLDQSRSDSCIFTPGDSGESGLASAQTEQTQSSGEADPSRLNNKSIKGFTQHSQCMNKAAILPTMNGIVSPAKEPVTGDLLNSKTDKAPRPNQNGVVDMEPSSQNVLANGNSVSGSQASGQSGSTSWMQMIMERSCNPDLKALLNRTAAAVDYKLAYAETFPTDCSLSSSIKQLGQDKHPLLCNTGTCGLSRSLSQGNLLTVAGLAGLRHALNQAAQYLPKGTAQVRSVGVTAELTSGGNSEAATGTSSCAEVNTSKTTTWAQKHGSRESLKRKTNKQNDAMAGPSPSSVPLANKTNPETSNPWREMKKASGTLITWNQLKRTIKGNHTGLERATTFRESRREQHQNAAVKNDNDLNDVTNPLPAETGAAVRSRSQPVSSGHYMHRFSGTLLEIFMRAKAEEMNFLNPAVDESGVPRGHAVSLDQTYDTPVTIPSSDKLHRRKVLVLPTSGRGVSGSDLVNSRSESDKHPLLRGDRILPQKWHPQTSSTAQTEPNSGKRLVCNFGAQFPPPSGSEEGFASGLNGALTSPQSPNCTSPIWSNGLPVRRSNAARYPPNRHSHPRNPSLPGRPQSFAFNKPMSNRHMPGPAVEAQSSSGAPLGIAACLTASAGPDSPYMAALRADYVADGYSAGWLGNPRASIAYPGLGLLSIPRPSRLTSASFLSHTLPDLSFLTQAAEEEERKGTPTMPKRLADCRCLSRDKAEHCCARCGCRSLSVGRAQKCKHKQRRTSAKSTIHRENDVPSGSSEFSEEHGTKVRMRGLKARISDPPPVIPDLVMGHKGSTPEGPRTGATGPRNPVSSLCHVDRSTSEPDLNAAVLNSTVPNPDSESTPDGSYSRPNALMTSSTQECYGWDSYKSHDDGLFSFSRPKKSVSFSGKIRLLRLQGLAGEDDDYSPASPEPRLIPRNWGLYGQETPLAEFNPRNSPGRDTIHGNELAQQSDVDIRYHGPHLTGVTYYILNDAVSQVKALTNVTLEKAKFKAFICACLNIGTYGNLTRHKIRSSLSPQCRSSQRGLHADLMTHLEQLLAFPFALDLAVEARKPLVDTSTVPKPSNSTGDANGQRAQATTATNTNNAANNHPISATNGEVAGSTAGQSSKVMPRPAIPPSIVTKRKQLVPTHGAIPNRARFSPPPSTASAQNPTIHHYPQHHLPGQRTSAAANRIGAPSRLSRPGTHRLGEDSGASSASSEPHTNVDIKSNQLRNSSSGASSTNGSNPSTRGRLKTALSTFRRTTPTQNNSTPSKPTTNNTGNNNNRPGHAPMIDSQSAKPNGSDASSSNTAASSASKTASKLKQPSTIVGRR